MLSGRFRFAVVLAVSSIPRVREGDFVETVEGLIFDVKGLVHPPDRVIAFLRYYPSSSGNREREGRRYAKVYHLAERFDVLRQHYPQYLYRDPVFGRELQGVPESSIRRVYRPGEALARLRSMTMKDSLQQDVVTFAELVQKTARVPLESLGVSGSVQVDLHIPSSDIDLIAYGRRAGQAVQLALRQAHQSPELGVAGYNLDTYEQVYNLRWSGSGMPIETMFAVDGPKAMHGVFGGHHYFVRAVLDWAENREEYGQRTYYQLGHARARCRISNAADGIFTPCAYEVDHVRFLEGIKAGDVREIVSFRGRFCEQVERDETVMVNGTLEEVRVGKEHWTRFLLGDDPRDMLIPERLIQSGGRR
jgi:predicted nucleotidyltransferase